MANLLTVDYVSGVVANTVTGTVMTLNSIAALLPASLAANGGLKIEGVAGGVAVPVSVASIPSHAVTNAGTFAVQPAGSVAHDGAAAAVNPVLVGGFASAAAPSDVSADADSVRAWNLRNGSRAVTLTAAGALIGGDAANGLDVDVTRLPALVAGSALIGKVDLQIAGTVVATGAGAVNAQTIRMTMADDAVGIVPTVAHDAADSGNPLKMGGRARSSEITPVANNDRSDFLTDLAGKLLTMPYANPENFISGAITSAMTGTTSTSLIASPGGSLRNYITQVTVSNSHATVGTDVVLQDGSGGTTLYTIPAAAVYGGAVLTFPVPLRQPTTATALFAANVTTGASVKISASGYKGV